MSGTTTSYKGQLLGGLNEDPVSLYNKRSNDSVLTSNENAVVILGRRKSTYQGPDDNVLDALYITGNDEDSTSIMYSLSKEIEGNDIFLSAVEKTFDDADDIPDGEAGAARLIIGAVAAGACSWHGIEGVQPYRCVTGPGEDEYDMFVTTHDIVATETVASKSGRKAAGLYAKLSKRRKANAVSNGGDNGVLSEH